MSTVVTASWYEASGYTAPNYDDVTASWYTNISEMPSTPLIINLLLPTGHAPIFKYESGDLAISLRLLFGTEVLALKLAPSSIISGYTSDGMSISIPIRSLPGLSIDEADPSSGNYIDIFQAICIADHAWHEEQNVFNALLTKASWNNRNMNAKSSKFRYEVGELITFLKHFTVAYGITKLVDEN